MAPPLLVLKAAKPALKEEQVRSASIAMDTANIIKGGLAAAKKAVSGASSFDALFAQLARTDQSRSMASLAPAPAPAPAVKQESSAANSRPRTPIQRLEAGMRKTGRPLESFRARPEDRERVQEVLVMSGYSERDAKEIVSRASEDDGSINLGAVVNLLPQYAPSQGPVLVMKQEDRPLLIQVLKDVGVQDSDLQAFLDRQPIKDGRLIISGLPELLKGVDSSGQAGSVDKSVLRDLLQGLGLNEKDIQFLMKRASDGQGRTNPQAMLELLTSAAARQQEGLGDALKELAQRMQINPAREQAAGDANRLKGEVQNALANLDHKPQNQQQPTDLEQAVKTALKTAGRHGDQNLQAGVDSQGGDASGREAESDGDRSGRRQAQARPQAGPAAPAKAPVSARGASGPSPAASAADAANGAASGGTGQIRQSGPSRPVLPPHVLRQVGRQMAQMAKTNRNFFRLELKPAELGELSLKLTVKDGVVRASMVAETAAAKHALDAGLDQLKQQLVQQGLKVERIEVMVNPDAQRQARNQEGGGSGSNGGRRGGRGPRGGAGLEGGVEGDMAAAAWDLASDAGRINLFA